MPRMTVCTAQGCPELVPAGRSESKCDAHARPAWSNPSRHTRERPRNWRIIRGRVKRRDRGRCVMCGLPGNEVDHIVPVSEGGTWDMDNLQLLCGPHHIVKTRMDRQRRSM